MTAATRRLLPVLRTAWVLLLPLPLCALDPGKAVTQYVHEVWQAEQGLPQNSVNAILQSRDGYLWLGTQEGLVRFDGVRFTVFDTRSTPELGHNWMLALHEDRAGNMWIGTSGGVVRRQGEAFTLFTSREGLPAEQVSAVLEDRRGRLWAGTTGGGLARLDGSRFVAGPTLPGRRVRALLEDREGTLWIGTESGLARLAGDTLSVLTRRDGLSHDSILALREGSDGGLWIGTEGGGLNELKDGRVRAITSADGLANDVVWSLHADRHGSLWIGTDGGGLQRLRDGRLATFSTREGLSNESVYALHEDREGSLWIGTDGGGLNRLKDGRLTTLTTREGLAHDIVRTVYEDRAGAWWIGTDGGGLDRVKDGVFSPPLNTTRGLAHDFVRAVAEDRNGVMWIGTRGGGVDRLKDGRLTPLTTRGGLASDFVRALYEDRAGRMWIGTDGGLSVVEGGAVRSWTTRDGLTNDIVQVVLEDRAGVLWIGTRGGGLNRLVEGRLSALTTRDGLSNDSIYALHEDRDGTLWVGTQGGGLNRVRDGRVASVTTRQGLFDDVVYTILEDGRDQLWMSSNKGIFRVGRADVNAVMDGIRASVVPVSYGAADGMRSAECNGAAQPAGWKLRDGRLLVPTLRGVVIVDPAHVPTNATPPPVVIERVVADQRPQALAGLRLAPGTAAVEVHYTALALHTPSRVRFRYRLEGFDDDWVDAGNRRTAYYTKLPHGSYRFRVIAANEDGVWNEEGAALPLVVEPRTWETAWFRTLAALGLVAALAGAYRVRMWQVGARERELLALVDERTRGLRAEKERTEAALSDAEEARRRAEEANRAKSVFLANMSHELRTPLNGVLGFAQLMARRDGRDPEDRQQLATILRSGEHLLGLINDVLSLSKIEAGRVALTLAPFDPAELVRGVDDMVRLRAEGKGLRFVVTPTGSWPPLVSGDEGRIRQVLLNLLGNAVKFTASGEVSLGAEWVDGRATFVVADSGPGIAASEQGALFEPFVQSETGRQSKEGTGLGLALSRQLARQMGGDIVLESEPGQGCRFTFTLDLPEASGTSPELEGARVVGLAPGQPPCRVLVVDDLTDNRALLGGILASAGFQVREAAGGEEALQVWAEWRPHLVCMDKRMPGMDGLETTRRIRAAEREAGIGPTRIVALSASALDHEREEILAAGSDDFLPKPFRASTLFAMVRQHLGLVYVYAGDAGAAAEPRGGALEAAALSALPEPLLVDMQRALLRGDTEEALRLTQAVEPGQEAVAREVRAMIEAFRLDELEALLAAAVSKPADPSGSGQA